MRRQRGFTLVELLAVMAIIGILAGVVAGSVSGLGASGQNAQIASDTNTLETAADRFFNASFPQVYPVSDPDTNGDGNLDDNDSPPSPAGDVNVRLIDFDARLPQDPTKTFAPDFIKDIPNSAALVSYRVETSTGAIFFAADGAALIPPANSRLNVNVSDKKTGNTTDVTFELTMRKNRAAVELLKVLIPAGYIIGGQSLSPGVQVGSLQIFFDVDNPWKPGHILKVSAPVLATGQANKWTVSPEYFTARSESDGSQVPEVKGAISFNEIGTIIRAAGPILAHQIDISSATTETPGTFTLKMDRDGGSDLAHNEAREIWILKFFAHPLGFSGSGGGEVIDLITNPTLDRVYRWTSREHSTIQVEDIFDQVAGKQAVLIKDNVQQPVLTSNTPPVANDQTVNDTVEGETTLIELTGSDTDEDSLKFIITSLPLYGTLRDAFDGQISFTPRELFGDEVVYTSETTGDLLTDSFTFVVNDGREDSDPATVQINFEDIISPAVSNVNPTGGANDVAVDTTITVDFSESVDIGTLSGSFSVLDGSTVINGTIATNNIDTPPNTQAVFTPTSPLTHETTYTVLVTTVLKDVAGNQLDTTFSSTFTTEVAPFTPPSGLVGWWPGDGNADDIVAGNDGTLLNGATFAAGKVGQAFSFDGVNDFVEVPDAISLDPTEITIATWVKIASTPISLGNIVSKGVNSGYRFRIENNRIVAVLDRGTTNILLTTGFIPLNQWTHIAVVGSSTGLRIYLDGVLDASNSVAYGAPDTTGTLKIGAEPEFGEFFNGLIDEVQIYSRALSASEIQGIFNAGDAG